MQKNEGHLESTTSAHAPAEDGKHGAAAIKLVFDQAVILQLKSRKFDELKAGNEKVYFEIDGQACFATSKYDMFADDKISFVYLNDRKVKLHDLNKLARRNDFTLDDAKTTELSRKYGRDTFAFVAKNEYSR